MIVSDSKVTIIVEIRKLLKCSLKEAVQIYNNSFKQPTNIIQRIIS
jgi:ribosomal protein L7/L12